MRKTSIALLVAVFGFASLSAQADVASAQKLADKVGLSRYKLLALVWHLKLQESDEYFKIIKIGSQVHKRYSQKAYEAIVAALEQVDMDEVAKNYKNR